jgi:curved DNA-binding protein CbpA
MSAPPGSEGTEAKPDDIELDPELRQAVLEIHAKLDAVDHYALLGVDRSGDRKAFKRAYYELAAKFHHDKHFRKKLGPFKVKMEGVFSRITLAHDTLVDASRRAEYDAYLQAQRKARSIEDLLSDAIAEVRRAEETVEQEVRLSGPPAVASIPPAIRSTPPGPQIDMSARRDALARRLLGGRSPSIPSPGARQATVPPQAPPTPAAAMEALRRRYEERVLQAKAAQSRKYIDKAKTALAAGDFVAAANSLRVASGLVPSDVETARMAKEAQGRADVLLGQTYTQQAEYEEKNGHWAEASRSWTRVCRARSEDIRAHERAANAIVKAAGDLHEAARLGQRACELDPTNAGARLTLANVYLAAGLELNARRELDAAARLAPHDGTIQEMVKKLGKPA